jgi:cobalt-zinc-cadmium efflux system outer membrane protein
MDEVQARPSDEAAHTRFLGLLEESSQEVPKDFDLSDGVSLPEGEVLALFYNANLRMARLQAGVALAQFENAGLWQDPVFGFDAAQVVSPSSNFEYGATLGVTLPVSGRLAVEKARAGAAYEVALRAIVDAEWSLRASVRRAWAEWTASERRRLLLEDVIADVERIGTLASRLEQAGAIRKADERLLRIELVGRRAELTAAELVSQRARIRLLGLMGLQPDAKLDIVASTATTPQVGVESLVEQVTTHNTELSLLRSRYRVAEEALRLAIRKQYPDLGLGAGLGSEEDDTRVLFGFTLPIPLLNRNRAEIAAARARRETARGAVETALERIVREAQELEVTLEATRRQRSQLTNELLPLLTEQSSNIDELAELGDVDAFLLLETVGRQFDAQARLIALARAEGQATARLNLLLGPPPSSSPTTVDDISLPIPGAHSLGTSTTETSQ